MIRPARQQEAQTVRDVVGAAYAHYVPRIGKRPGPMLDDYEQRIARDEAWVLDDAGTIVGVLVLEESADGFLLDNVAVLPRCQGKGYGRQLLEFAELEASRRGHGSIRLYTHVLMAENIALYRQLGYVETHRRTERGFDRVYMEKRL